MTRFAYLGLFSIVSMLTAGCSDEQFETAPVSGTVTSDGTAVPEGTIVFNPIAKGSNTMVGKSATGYIKDGNFVLSTYSNADGAVIGEHSVIVTGKETPPENADEIEWGSAPNWGSTTQTFTVVTGTDNTFEIKLTAPQQKKGKRRNDDEDDD